MKSSQQIVNEAKARIVEVSVQELASALQDHHAILIDVREPDEFIQGYVDRSVNYPRGVLEMRIHQHPSVGSNCDTMTALEQLAAKPIYLMCRSGARSALAADALKNMGFTQVLSVAGGFQAWLDAGYPVER
ncbi:sulfurtransferase [Rheinheimera sp. KL1]|uniref:rhodanese-like domain-containing protein n=1 Tax=Rheinheimera sp. KL1 TaxID=1635005 RepID=UPI0006A964BF|nr:rhodanese-like domain-containing protein [Rheinheimera sp. KL1]KOO57573.1 sulfurtransferase [Rheinheimera sp. KL1]